jgi:glycosyltransferase involved in cell wall biosynthesis
MLNVLYVFGGEKASGAEKVIQRLVVQNTAHVNAHLFISPGNFAQTLLDDPNSSFIKKTLVSRLKKLNRSSTGKLKFYLNALLNYFSVSWLAYRYVMKNKIDVVHANTIVPASYLLPAILFSKILNPQVKWFWSDHDLRYFSSLDHKLSALCVNTFDLTLVVSEAVKTKYGSHTAKIEVLYNGLNINEFKSKAALRKTFRQNHKIEDQTMIIGLAGTIEPRKGQLALINAFVKINKEFAGSRLLLAGPPSADEPVYVDDVLKAIKQNPSIIYLGKISDMVSFYNGCDIIVNNSSNEGSEPLGTTLYEAMACEKIVAASATGGTPEIIDNKINGYLFKPDSAEDVYQILRDIMVNINSLQKIKENARIKASERFNILTMAERYNLLLSNKK